MYTTSGEDGQGRFAESLKQGKSKSLILKYKRK